MKDNLLEGHKDFRLDIPADENNLSEVRDFIADICKQAGFSKRETNNTKLAMDEACTNIIKHAYKDVAGNIRIEVSAKPGKLDINIFDRGKTFEWSNVKDPDLQRYVEIGKKGGLGIYLMNRLMDDIDYESSRSGNRLFMSKTSDTLSRDKRIPLFTSVKPRWTSTLRFKFFLRAATGLLSLVLFLGIVQFVNQTREVGEQERLAWLNVTNLARTIESKSETAMVLDDLYDPEYREINDFIQDRISSLPEVIYIRVINQNGVIVSSNLVEEFLEEYELPAERRDIPREGDWVSLENSTYGQVEEFHYPVRLTDTATETQVYLGRIILGVSRSILEEKINDPRPRTIMILFGIFLVGLSLIYLLISVFVKPIQDLTDGVRAIGEGALEDGIHIDGPEEIGAIASAFNEITMKFRDAQKNVVEQERLQKEMQVAQEIQHSLLPAKVPQISGYDIGSLYRAAKEVGGDYYDFVSVGEDSLGVVVADVSGKGVPGSLVMTMIRTALRMEARGSLSAAEVMSRMNDFVTEDMKKGMFVTIFYVILDSKNRIISYASAGHNPMILFRAETDETFFLNPRGFPVGISLPDDTLFRRSIDVEKIKLKKDDMLIIYTDGVTEAMNEERDQYGEDRLINFIKTHGRNTPESFIDGLNDDIKRFTGDYPQNDDITVVAIKEKMMADDVLFGIRKKLMDLVEIEGYSVAEACSMMKISPSTYYRYRKRLTEMGERGLKNKTLREEHEIRRVSIDQRKALLSIIKSNPKFGAKRIANEYNEGKVESEWLTPSLIYDELKRMRLNTYEKRLEYLRRNRFITEEAFQEMLAAPGGKKAAPLPDDKDQEGKTEETSALERESGVDESVGTGEKVAEHIGAGLDEIETKSLDEVLEEVAGQEKTGVFAGISEGEEEKPDNIEGLLSRIRTESDGERGIARIEPVEYPDGVIVLRVKGHLDSSSASDLENVLENLYEYGCTKIIVDLVEVSYISSGGWGIFTGRVKSLREGGGDVVLAGMSPEVFDIYQLLGFQDIIMHFQTVEESVEFISLPFEERQGQLDAISEVRSKDKVLEHRVSAVDLESDDLEENAPWTPLVIEAGTVGESGEITVLNLKGVIDTVSCMKLKEVMNELLESGSTRLVVDMSLVEYVSSAGWGVFASRIDDLRSRGGDIKIFGMDPEVDSIFHLLGFDVIMRSFSILAEAIEDFRTETVLREEGKEADTDRFRAAYRPKSEVEKAEIESALKLEVSRKESSDSESMIIQLGGAIDAATTVQFEVYLEKCIAENPRYFILDLSDVIYISSSGWGVIVKYMQILGDRSGKIALSGMTQPIFKIFRDLGFEPLIPYFHTAEEALAKLSAPSVEDHLQGTPEVIEKEEKMDAAETTVAEEIEVSDERRTAVDEGNEESDEAGPAAPSPSGKGVEGENGAEPFMKRKIYAPLREDPPRKVEKLDIVLDLETKKDVIEKKDSKIRELGWKEYGKKLTRSNKDRKKD